MHTFNVLTFNARAVADLAKNKLPELPRPAVHTVKLKRSSPLIHVAPEARSQAYLEAVKKAVKTLGLRGEDGEHLARVFQYLRGNMFRSRGLSKAELNKLADIVDQVATDFEAEAPETPARKPKRHEDEAPARKRKAEAPAPRKRKAEAEAPARKRKAEAPARKPKRHEDEAPRKRRAEASAPAPRKSKRHEDEAPRKRKAEAEAPARKRKAEADWDAPRGRREADADWDAPSPARKGKGDDSLNWL